MWITCFTSCAVRPLPCRRIRRFDLTGSRQLRSLPDWLVELRQLDSLVLRGCTNLKRLPEGLWKIYDKYKNLLVDLTGCAALFLKLNTKAEPGRRGSKGHTEFRDAAQLDIVRELMARAEIDNALDQVTVYDGHGVRFAEAHDLACGA